MVACPETAGLVSVSHAYREAEYFLCSSVSFIPSTGVAAEVMKADDCRASFKGW